MYDFLIEKMQNIVLYKSPIGEAYTKFCDLRHHLKYAFIEDSLNNDKSYLKYFLTKQYHIIEKGLALPEPRLGFGQEKIMKVIKKTKNYEILFGADELTTSIRKTISEYLIFHESRNFSLPENFKSSINNFLNQKKLYGNGGTKVINGKLASTLSPNEFRQFAKSRVSVRDFSEEEVPENIIYSAIDTAKTSPSVCNRQGWKVHLYIDKYRIKEILANQNGNSGFTDVINKLIIVTADAKAFTRYESNQVYIDGGLFSMNLLLALHAEGLGACPLNTCVPYFKENKIKKISSIPDNERLIMMIAVGSLKSEYNVACSVRNPTKDFFTTHLI